MRKADTARVLGIVAMVLASLLLAGCDADTIMSTGSLLGNLGSVGFGNAGDMYVEAARDSINGFMAAFDIFGNDVELTYSFHEAGEAYGERPVDCLTLRVRLGFDTKK